MRATKVNSLPVRSYSAKDTELFPYSGGSPVGLNVYTHSCSRGSLATGSLRDFKCYEARVPLRLFIYREQTTLLENVCGAPCGGVHGFRQFRDSSFPSDRIGNLTCVFVAVKVE